MKCAVATCANYHTKTKENNINYHRFPKDEKYRKMWIVRCKRSDDFNVNSARICSKHFTDSDYHRDLKSELLNIAPKKILKADAIPTVNLPKFKNSDAILAIRDDNDAPSERSKRKTKRDIRKNALDRIKSLNPETDDITGMKIQEPRFHDKSTQSTESSAAMAQKIDRLQSYVRYLQESKNKMGKNLKAKNAKLMQRFLSLKKNQKALFEEKMKETLGKMFTRNQIQILLKKKSSGWWDKETINKALNLRALSPVAYTHLREREGYPLPCVTTLKRWKKLHSENPDCSEINESECTSTSAEVTEKTGVSECDPQSREIIGELVSVCNPQCLEGTENMVTETIIDPQCSEIIDLQCIEINVITVNE